MRQVVALVAANHQGKVSEHYLSFYGGARRTSLRLAIITPQLERGFGLDIDRTTKALVFRGDPYGVESAYAALQKELIQAFVSAATIQALAALGYQAQVSEEKGQISISGVAYA